MQKQTAELTALIQQCTRKPSDVFWATRFVNGNYVAGFWYRIFEDDTRQRWTSFGFAGDDFETAKRFIEGFRLPDAN